MTFERQQGDKMMRKMKMVFAAICALLLLSACADKGNDDSQVEETTDDDEKIGYSMTGGTIEEASGVPEDEKEAILAAFDKYISTFNDRDVEGYMDMIGSEYDKEEEREFLEAHFENYEQLREPSNVTIVKYKEGEAQVFASINNQLKQLSTGFETSDEIRQVTVFTKEDDEWKVKSVHSIGENSGAEQ